jgi:hypothetical protein
MLGDRATQLTGARSFMVYGTSRRSSGMIQMLLA